MIYKALIYKALVSSIDSQGCSATIFGPDRNPPTYQTLNPIPNPKVTQLTIIPVSILMVTNRIHTIHA